MLRVSAGIAGALLLNAVNQRRVAQQSASVWLPTDFADPHEWTIDLTDEEREEIVEATRRATAAGKTIEDLRVEDYPLPTIAARAIEWSELLSARGFLLLRRFPIDRLDPAAVEMAYLGLGLQLGNPVGQDATGALLGHVRDEGVARTDPSVRLYRTRSRQDFHTDGADLVGLLCLQRATSGGESRIASSAAVYNELLRRRPDLIEVLYSPFYWDRNDEQSEGEDPFFALPVYNDVNGAPRMFYIGWYIRDAQRHPAVPRLTDSQIEAMELVETIANDPAFHIEMNFQPGDVQLLNNAKILHAREAYEDADDPREQRHLLRLWLTAHHFTSVEGFLQSGIPPRR
ncbi:MAG TPA: TauD/TfdA family dioxygenase [Acidimicrobiia bacterium]|nr:TauD/TfdA family dioxygenase [Acidimicrobiia bacterium]